MSSLQESNLSILGDIIFVVNAYYLLWAAIKGNMTYGARTACFTFHPIT
jgi:hypothetical protein